MVNYKKMLNKKMCSLSGGIPPLNSEEIEMYIKDLDPNWSVIEEKKLEKLMFLINIWMLLIL